MALTDRKKKVFLGDQLEKGQVFLEFYNKARESTDLVAETFWWTAVFHHPSSPQAGRISREMILSVTKPRSMEFIDFGKNLDRAFTTQDLVVQREIEREEKKKDALPHFVQLDPQLHELDVLALGNFLLLLADIVEKCKNKFQLRAFAFFLNKAGLDKCLDYSANTAFGELLETLEEMYLLKREGSFDQQKFIGGNVYQTQKAKREIQKIVGKLFPYLLNEENSNETA
jgi:hypothetical protein